MDARFIVESAMARSLVFGMQERQPGDQPLNLKCLE